MTGVYTERLMCNALARGTFADSLVVVDHCTWPGGECDLLVVTRNLRVIDVEVKVTRTDLKKDRDKQKWMDSPPWRPDPGARRVEREWPRRVWKHYYAVAAPTWRDDMLEHCGAKSGVLVVTIDPHRPRTPFIDVKRRAQPCRDNQPLQAEDVVAIARLASLRMWDAYVEVERGQREGEAAA